MLVKHKGNSFEYALSRVDKFEDLFEGPRYWGIYGGEFFVSYSGRSF